jgi:hypothetical protein
MKSTKTAGPGTRQNTHQSAYMEAHHNARKRTAASRNADCLPQHAEVSAHAGTIQARGLTRRAFLKVAGIAGALVAGTGAVAAGRGGLTPVSGALATESASSATSDETRTSIESALNLANMGASWSYADGAWTMAPVTAVTNAELPDEQGVSVCVPAAYVTGIDTDGDGVADVTADSYSESVTGNLVIDHAASVTSENGQIYTADTAPIILNTGAAGYSSTNNSNASSTYAVDGYINVSCGNRGKQDQVTASDGTVSYTGDAPCCLVDQKDAARFVKYNVLLGNLPGNVNYLVSTGGSGGGAHASMFAATSNNPDFYDYEIEAGAVGIYRNEDGSYTSAVTINGEQIELSDGAWGCIAYSAITPLYEADMDLAFEYFLDPTYSFNTDFQRALAAHLASDFADYINGQQFEADEAAMGVDVDGDGATSSTVALTVDYDADAYADTNGYGGTYLDLYLAKFRENLQWYLDNLDYATDWTWFDADGNALSDEDVAAMTTADKQIAFIEGRYAKSQSSEGMGGMGAPGDMGATGGMSAMGELPSGEAPSGDVPSGEMPSDMGDGSATLPDGTTATDTAATDATATDASSASGDAAANTANQLVVGTPDAGTTQSAGSATDSSNYATYDEMLAAYESDVNEVYEGDEYGNNIVALYNPMNYIGAEGTEAPTWTRIMMGASEGDMSLLASMNMQLKWLANGTDAVVQWQWDGGHVPSEILGESFSLYVDEMYGEYVDGAVAVTKPEPTALTANGTATEPTGTDISSWVNYDDPSAVTFSLADAAAYRTAGASKACPGFDVIDYGQEDYVFGSATADARHWDEHLVHIFEDNADELSALFNAGSSEE